MDAMTLDEAIEHAEWAADNCEGECSEEHRQLAEWLKELKQWKKLVEGIDLRPASLMVPFQPNVNDLERENDRLNAENEKLRELVLYMFDFYCTFREEPHTDLEELKASIEAWKRMQELGIEVDNE